jgi:hypothetical protein
MRNWSREAIEAYVDELARSKRGDAFVTAVRRFGEVELDRGEQDVLADVLLERADLRRRIGDAARERSRQGWSRRMLEGRASRPRPGADPR